MTHAWIRLIFPCGLVLCLLSCGETREPEHLAFLELRGSPYERGYAHGEAMGDRIRSLYATLLSNSLLPYLNREQADVASVLMAYREDPEDGVESLIETWKAECRATCITRCEETCSFSYFLMLESALAFKAYIPQDYLDEMQGVADGSGLSFEKILILNTFFDTLLAFRSITSFIRQIQAPMVESAQILPGLESDGRDNNGDGGTDEAGEGTMPVYEPSDHASWVGVPADASVEWVMHDIKLGIGVDKGDEPGVDPETIRIRLDETQYEYPKDAGIIEVFEVTGDPERVRVRFTPPGGFTPGTAQTILLQAGDKNQIVNPPPIHARFMRDEKMTLGIAGLDKAPHEIPNRGPVNPNAQPPSIAFAVRGEATPDGAPLLAHHYALLDSNTVHKHGLVALHKPDDGPPFLVIGYTGIIWGFNGINEAGLAAAFNNSDTLNNAMTSAFITDLFDARLVMRGTPIGVVLRELLARQRTVAGSTEILRKAGHTFGWNVLLADASHEMALVELDADVNAEPDRGVFLLGPDRSDPANLDPWGQPLATLEGDDLRAASHYLRNLEDINQTVLLFDVKPQRYWTSFFFRSVRTFHRLGERLTEEYGRIDEETAMEILRTDDLVDQRDSMIAAIYKPEERVVFVALGEVPATDAPFVRVDLSKWLRTGVAP